MSSNRYEKRGVSADKSEVHIAIKDLDKGLYPNAFCKILPDLVAGDRQFVNVMHADTAGTKTSLAYMYWKETGDYSIWKGISQDSLVMNVDDMACVGCVDDIIISSTIGRNKHLIDGQVIGEIIRGNVEFVERMKKNGVNVYLSGGETADVGDIVRTVDVGITAFGRIKKSNVIECNIVPGNVIVGLSCSGQASYEETYNSGISSNGLTSARHDVLNKSYAQNYPESFTPDTNDEYVYSGTKFLGDSVSYDGIDYTVGQLLLSPTRTFLPVLKKIIESIDKPNGIIHCTGGAQTKVLHFVEGVHIVKNNLFDIPPVFRLIKQESQASWKEMYEVFNMGHRIEIYTSKNDAESIISIANQFNIEAQIIGYVEESNSKKVTIQHQGIEVSFS